MRPINVNVLMDALLIATLSGSVILAATLIAGRRSIRSIRSIRSGQLQHQIHVHAIVSSALILALVVLFRPDPVGCIARRCGQDKARADHAAQVQQQFTALAAEKFSRFSDFSAPMSPGSSTPESIRSDDGAAAGDGPLRIAATLLDGAGSGAILTGLWLMGVAAFLVRIRRRRRLARRMVREAGPVEYAEIRHRFAILAARAGIRKPLRLREHPDLAVPVVTGAIRPVVLLPTGIQSRAEAEMIFLHELGHIRRGDLLLTLICEIGASLFWFNPLVWLALRRMIV